MGVLAWLFNLALLGGAGFGMLTILWARHLLPRTLHAGSVDEATWRARLGGSFAMSVLNSLVLVDALKVVCLTLTSAPALAAFGLEQRSASAPARIVRKLLRRAHKVLDALVE